MVVIPWTDCCRDWGVMEEDGRLLWCLLEMMLSVVVVGGGGGGGNVSGTAPHGVG